MKQNSTSLPIFFWRVLRKWSYDTGVSRARKNKVSPTVCRPTKISNSSRKRENRSSLNTDFRPTFASVVKRQIWSRLAGTLGKDVRFRISQCRRVMGATGIEFRIVSFRDFVSSDHRIARMWWFLNVLRAKRTRFLARDRCQISGRETLPSILFVPRRPKYISVMILTVRNIAGVEIGHRPVDGQNSVTSFGFSSLRKTCPRMIVFLFSQGC